MQNQSIECAICSERFGNNSSGDANETICSTPCGHVYHQGCILKWLSASQADTCPECREMVAAKDLRRIYFNFSPMMDSMQTYIDDLNSEIMNIANKLQHVKLQNMKLKNDCSNQLREKDNEIHKLQEFKIKHELQKYQKIKKAHRARERAKYAEVLCADQLYPWPIDMTAHNPNIVQNPMQTNELTAMFQQSTQPSTSAAMRINDSIPATSGAPTKSSTSSTEVGVAHCHSTTDAATQLLPTSDDQNSANNANLPTVYSDRHPYILQQRLTMPSSSRRSYAVAQTYQSSMLQNSYISWMTSGNSPMLMATAATAPQQNVNYQQNLFLQQPQSNNNVNSGNVHLSYVNGSQNGHIF